MIRNTMENFGSTLPKQNNSETKINERIRVPEVKVIDENGQQLGAMPTKSALTMARERGLDLVEVSANERPPVCKFLDYGKQKYEKKRKEKDNRKKTVHSDLKEIQLRPNIEDHDLNVKIKKIEEFLVARDKVRLVIIFQGREVTYARQHGSKLMNKITEATKGKHTVDSPAKLEGKRMTMVLSPVSK